MARGRQRTESTPKKACHASSLLSSFSLNFHLCHPIKLSQPIARNPIVHLANQHTRKASSYICPPIIAESSSHRSLVSFAQHPLRHGVARSRGRLNTLISLATPKNPHHIHHWPILASISTSQWKNHRPKSTAAIENPATSHGRRSIERCALFSTRRCRMAKTCTNKKLKHVPRLRG